MNNEFKREERYIVFKMSDLGNSLKGDEIRKLAREYAEQRRLRGKEPLECVVVEKDWPEYEPTWRAIEARVTGAQAQPTPSLASGDVSLISEGKAQHAPSAPSEEAAAEMGANGGHVVEAERLAFEAWMRGHCWKLGAKWTGTEYRSAFEKGGMVDMHAMRTRELWAAWRDRAALAAAPEAKP